MTYTAIAITGKNFFVTGETSYTQQNCDDVTTEMIIEAMKTQNPETSNYDVYSGMDLQLSSRESSQDKVHASSENSSSGAAKFIEGTNARALISKKGEFINNKYGHLQYKDCKKEDLVTLANGIQIHKNTAAAFNEMQKAAKKDGINLQIVSGFRSTARQVRTFAKKFPDGKIENATEAQIRERARWSAPAGYSEHHTGYAIDINSTESSFGETKAYQWLKEHAAEYGFEISFKENNQQGVGFEPWHWRYIGDEAALETFRTARSLK